MLPFPFGLVGPFLQSSARSSGETHQASCVSRLGLPHTPPSFQPPPSLPPLPALLVGHGSQQRSVLAVSHDLRAHSCLNPTEPSTVVALLSRALHRIRSTPPRIIASPATRTSFFINVARTLFDSPRTFQWPIHANPSTCEQNHAAQQSPSSSASPRPRTTSSPHRSRARAVLRRMLRRFR